MDGACGMYGSQEINTKLWLESFSGRKHLRDHAVDERIILKLILKKFVMKMWTVLNLPRILSRAKTDEILVL
jgi:hypothetical protein